MSSTYSRLFQQIVLKIIQTGQVVCQKGRTALGVRMDGNSLLKQCFRPIKDQATCCKISSTSARKPGWKSLTRRKSCLRKEILANLGTYDVWKISLAWSLHGKFLFYCFLSRIHAEAYQICTFLVYKRFSLIVLQVSIALKKKRLNITLQNGQRPNAKLVTHRAEA